MSQPTQRVTDWAAYNDPFYAQFPIAGPPSAGFSVQSGQFDVGGAAYNQVNVKYPNTVPMLDAGTLIYPVVEQTVPPVSSPLQGAVKSNI